HVIASLTPMRLLRGLGLTGALAIALIGVAAIPGVARAACAPSPSLSPYGFTKIEPDNPKPPFLVSDCTATTRLGLTLASPSPSAPVSTSAPVGPPAPVSAAPATAELTVFPTSSAHPDFVTGAIFIVIFALLLAIAYTVRVLRRRRHRWD
ncbi:MAG TPA: hypothetical protein VN683_09040, partial [Acidothermaceae bacterium]|nr:hypothetical protein [Acidothermaceae bacterium]